MGKIEPRSARSMRPQSAERVLSALLEQDAWMPDMELTHLWECWDMVMGPALAPLAIPLGRHKRTLLLGAEDAMAAQELAMQAGEILERVNAFMRHPSLSPTGALALSPAFSKVKVEQVMGRRNLARPRPPSIHKSPPPPLERPAALGGLTGTFDPSSAIGRCYAAYLAYFDRHRA